MSPEQECQSERIRDALRAEMADVAPVSAAGYAQFAGGTWRIFTGESQPGAEICPFDLASVSKPLTALLTAKLIKEGHLTYETPLQEVLQEVAGTYGGSQSIEALLSHRAGLLPHVELFRESWSGRPIDHAALLRRAASSVRTPLDHTPLDHAPVYSDLGYILVGAALSRLCGQDLDVALAQHLLFPWNLRIGSARAFLLESSSFVEQAVPTEIQVIRGGLLRGVVHDDNAWALAGHGAPGHAGLFGTLRGVLRLGMQLLDRYNGRRGADEQEALWPLVRPRPGGTLRMGFDGVSGTISMAGTRAGQDTFGHLGFTGTSLWCDPGRDRVTVLLSNRVWPHRDNPRIRRARPKIHDFLWDC